MIIYKTRQDNSVFVTYSFLLTALNISTIAQVSCLLMNLVFEMYIIACLNDYTIS